MHQHIRARNPSGLCVALVQLECAHPERWVTRQTSWADNRVANILLCDTWLRVKAAKFIFSTDLSVHCGVCGRAVVAVGWVGATERGGGGEEAWGKTY